MARKNIKVPENLFLALRDDKDDEQSWPHYLEQQCLMDGGDDATVDEEYIIDEIVGRIDDLEATLPRKVGEELR